MGSLSTSPSIGCTELSWFELEEVGAPNPPVSSLLFTECISLGLSDLLSSPNLPSLSEWLTLAQGSPRLTQPLVPYSALVQVSGPTSLIQLWLAHGDDLVPRTGADPDLLLDPQVIWNQLILNLVACRTLRGSPFERTSLDRYCAESSPTALLGILSVARLS